MNNPEGNIPWESYAIQERLNSVVWPDAHGRKRTLERCVLPNGIHFAFILDEKTGKRVFDTGGFELSRQHPDLGDGHYLQTFITLGKKWPWSKDKVSCTSFIKKQVDHHEVTYDVDPLRHTLRLGYLYQEPSTYTKIVLRPHIEPTWGSSHSIFVDNHFQTEFDQSGRLEQVWFRQGRELYLSGDELYDRRVHTFLESYFGISYEDPLVLNVYASTERLLKNIDVQNPINPIQLLAFHDAVPLHTSRVPISSFV